MKILFLSAWYPHPPDNGSKLRVYHLLRALAQSHDVTLLSFAFATARPEAVGDLRTLCTAVQVVPVNPFEVNRAGALRTFLSTRPMASRPIPAMTRLVTGALQVNAFDVVIASTEMMADYAQQAGTGTIKILEEHNSMTRWASERYLGATGPVQRARCWLSWQKNRRHEALLYPRFDLITMVSEEDHRTTASTVGKHGPRIEVVPNGVDCQHNRPGLARPRPAALVYNGSLTYSANYDAVRWFLAQVWPAIRTQVPDATLTITGSTEGVDLRGLALDDSVHLTDYVEDVRIPVAEASVAVAPIRQGGGTRLKILEAMALGTPVVATSKGAEGLQVTHGEHLIVADDAETFALRTVELLDNPDLRSRLAAGARCLVEERYDWNQIGRHFAALIEETAGRQ